MTQNPKSTEAKPALTVACLLVLVTYGLMIDLKGIWTDEGIRLAIINGGMPFTSQVPTHPPTWGMVLQTGAPYAYQPLYYLMQNTLMRVAQSHNVIFFRLVNIFFLWVSLQGLIALSKGWRTGPQLFLIGLFSFNAYLIMHVLQIREYIAGVAFYIWSTWLVLQLVSRKLGRAWADVAWFTAYGILLTIGFYLQSWVVFPVIGQGLFLLWRRRGDQWRFYAHLALSYMIVLSTTWPYLQSHQQRANVGRWGAEGTSLWPLLSDGFHLVLTGHSTGHSPFTEFLFWFWIAVLAGTAWLLFIPKSSALPVTAREEFKRQGVLMILCSGVSLAFQVGYFLKVENLSVWPRYFVIHYFFLIWFIALGFKYLDDLRSASTASVWPRRGLTLTVAAIAIVSMVSAVFQISSYYKAPLLDTGLSQTSNWRTVSTELARTIRPDDTVVVHDFIVRATLTFTRPIPNPVIMLQDMEINALQAVKRIVYLESSGSFSERENIITRMSTLGFKSMQAVKMHSPDGSAILPEWQFLIFLR